MTVREWITAQIKKGMNPLAIKLELERIGWRFSDVQGLASIGVAFAIRLYAGSGLFASKQAEWIVKCAETPEKRAELIFWISNEDEHTIVGLPIENFYQRLRYVLEDLVAQLSGIEKFEEAEKIDKLLKPWAILNVPMPEL